MNGRNLKFLNFVERIQSRPVWPFGWAGAARLVDVIDTIEELLKQHPAPHPLEDGNGPELLAHALQEWVHRKWALASAYIPPGITPGRIHSLNPSMAAQG